MRLIDVDALLNSGYPTIYHTEYGDEVINIEDIKNAPIVTGIISAKDFKKRINNMEYIYLQSCAEDVIDAIDCEVTYFKEKMSKDPNSES